MGKIRIYAEVVDEARKLQKDYSLDYNAAIRQAKEIYKDKLEKAHSLTDQSIVNKHEQTFNDIIADTEDVDNGQVYDKLTGNTIKDL